MASISKLQTAKDGRRYWKIQVSKGKGVAPAAARFYWPQKKNGDSVSEKVALHALDTFAAEFESKVKSGEILSRKEAAEQKAAEDRQRAELKTVKQYAEGVYMARKKLELEEKTRRGYQTVLDKQIYPVFGDSLMQDITPAMINKLLIDFQQSGRAFSYLHQVFVVLNGIFSSAYRDGTISEPVMLKVEKPRQRKDNVTIPETEKALSLEMLNHILDCVAGEPIKWQAYINLAADTGARRGELVGLQWSDIDEEEKSITISRNVQYTPEKGVYVTTPKNGKKRVVDIGQETLDLLTALHEKQKADAKKQEKKTGVLYVSPWIFNQDGTAEVMHPDSPNRYYKKFGDRYGVPGFHPHLLRHTSASLAITEGGADIVSVSQRLGHSDTAVTLRMYSHASADSVRRAGQGVRDALKRAKTPKAEGGN